MTALELAPAVKPDPPVRADGSCVVCGKPRRTRDSRRYAGHAAELDPFCSTTCTRRWHGCVLPVSPDSNTGRKKRFAA